MQETINLLETIKDNETLIVACSGGPDSMCLLSLLCSIKDKKNFNIICAHVNHKIRIESNNEALMVKKYCKKNNITFEYTEFNEFKDGNFTEELARKKRYEFFNSLIKKYSAKYLFTAHHGDDLIETILMRITRGSTLSGYAGIRIISKNNKYKIIRPLLYVTKDDIIKYLNENNIPYAIDKSNNNLKYTRNRYRHKILPELKKENIDIHKKYLKFSEELQDYELFVNNYIKEKEFINNKKIDTKKIKKESLFIKRKTIELLIKDIQLNDILDISDNNMTDLLKLLDKNNKSINLNNGYIASNSYGVLSIVKKEENNFSSIIFDKDITINNYNFYYTNEYEKSNYTVALLSTDVNLPLKFRTKKDGDKMKVLNLKGTKKVKDIFIDSKIELNKRDSYPILVDNKDNVLWIPGIKKSQFCKDKNEKYDIIIKCEER